MWREDMWNKWLVKAMIPDAWPHPAIPSSRRRSRGRDEGRYWRSLCRMDRHNYMSLVFNLQIISDPEPGCSPTSYHDKIWVCTILPVLFTWEGSSGMEAGRELWYVVMGQDLPVYCWEHQTSEQEAYRQVRAWSLQHAKCLWWEAELIDLSYFNGWNSFLPSFPRNSLASCFAGVGQWHFATSKGVMWVCLCL